MIPIPSGRVWIATGHTDMRRGMRSLALTIQESFKRDPHAGEGTLAFTDFGIETLEELIRMHKADPDLLKRPK